VPPRPSFNAQLHPSRCHVAQRITRALQLTMCTVLRTNCIPLETRGKLGSHPRFSLSYNPSKYRRTFPSPIFSGGGKIGDDRDASETVDNLQPKPSPFHSNTIPFAPFATTHGIAPFSLTRYLPATFQRIP
jgi:hypothetical protein